MTRVDELQGKYPTIPRDQMIEQAGDLGVDCRYSPRRCKLDGQLHFVGQVSTTTEERLN